MYSFLRSTIALVALMGGTFAYSESAAPLTDNGPVTWRGGGGWGAAGCDYCEGYDLKNLTSLSGSVERVETLTPVHGMREGIHLLLKTDKETVSVHLGPSWYIENQDVVIAPKDKIKVSGVRTQWNGAPAVIAFEVEKDGKTLALRNEQGRPAWAGWRGGPNQGRLR